MFTREVSRRLSITNHSVLFDLQMLLVDLAKELKMYFLPYSDKLQHLNSKTLFHREKIGLGQEFQNLFQGWLCKNLNLATSWRMLKDLNGIKLII